jgi:hypothetical protein
VRRNRTASESSRLFSLQLARRGQLLEIQGLRGPCTGLPFWTRLRLGSCHEVTLPFPYVRVNYVAFYRKLSHLHGGIVVWHSFRRIKTSLGHIRSGGQNANISSPQVGQMRTLFSNLLRFNAIRLRLSISSTHIIVNKRNSNPSPG